MVMSAQPRPWSVTSGREIADGNGNVVQYTMENLGQVCLAVNSYDRLVSALTALDDWLGQDKASRSSDEDMRAAVRQAIGRIGCEQLASMIEAASDASPDLDRRIATELGVPEVGYTGSMDAAMTLVPKGWKYSVSDQERLDVTTNETATFYTIECRSPEGRTVSATSRTFARALSASALRAHDIAR